MSLNAAILPLLAAALLGACTAASSTVGAVLPAGTYVSASVSGHQLVAGSKVRLVYDGNLSANAGCNTMSGPAAVSHGTLVVGQLATTEMACNSDLMAQDQWLAGFLDGAAFSYGPDATLTLRHDGIVLTLVSQLATSLPLEGTTWTLDGIVQADTVASVPRGVTATLVFQDGRVDASTGCNTGRGTAIVANGRISFGPVTLTKMACTTWAGAVETQMVKVLAGDQPYTIDGDSLTVGGGTGLGLQLVGPSSSAGPS
jgi:heat shock protein HslJ